MFFIKVAENASAGNPSMEQHTRTMRSPAVSRDTQERFERLVQTRRKEIAKETQDSKSKLSVSTPRKENELNVDKSSAELPPDAELGLFHGLSRTVAEAMTPHTDNRTEFESKNLAPDQTNIDQALIESIAEDTTKDQTASWVEGPSETQEESTNTSESSVVSGLPTPLELFSHPAPHTSNTAIEPERISMPVDTRVVDLVRQVVDRISVSDASCAVQAVHIQVKDAILPGTEIRLTQQVGQLQVNLITDQDSSFAVLAQHQAALSTQLEQHLGQDIVVHVDFDSAARFTQQDSTSNSEGYDTDQDSANEQEADAE